jgi:26S proteasome regulatory subunit N10
VRLSVFSIIISRLTVQQRPTRFQAQADAINLIHSAKTQANPESSVGLMSMGGKGPEVLVTLTADIGKILDGLHRTKIRGNSHLASSIQVAAVSGPHESDRSAPSNYLDYVASAQAPSRKGSEAANHRVHMFSHR